MADEVPIDGHHGGCGVAGGESHGSQERVAAGAALAVRGGGGGLERRLGFLESKRYYKGIKIKINRVLTALRFTGTESRVVVARAGWREDWAGILEYVSSSSSVLVLQDEKKSRDGWWW